MWLVLVAECRRLADPQEGEVTSVTMVSSLFLSFYEVLPASRLLYHISIVYGTSPFINSCSYLAINPSVIITGLHA